MRANAQAPSAMRHWRMRRATASFIAATTSIAALALCGAAHAEGEADEPTAVPYRPSVSTPAALSAPGWLEVEAGLLHQHAGEGERRDSLPVTLKLAFTPDWGVRVGTDAWVRSRAAGDGRRESGYGDTAIVLKRRFAVDEAQAFGLEAGAVLPTARRRDLGSGSGKADYGLNAIYSADFGDGWHTDINLAGTRHLVEDHMRQAQHRAPVDSWLDAFRPTQQQRYAQLPN